MIPIDFKGSNAMLIPQDATIESIPARVDLTDEGFVTTICLKLTKEEIEHLTSGKKLWITSLGAGVPPQRLYFEPPFEDYNE